MKISEITLLTVSFNNNVLTTMMIKSFYKQVCEVETLIIDNSTAQPISSDMKKIFNVIDNTNQKITGNYNQCSKNHCSAVDYALKNCIKTKWCLLVDNDILFKPEVKKLLTEFKDYEFDCCGEIGWDDAPPVRLFPYFCLINVEKFRNEKVNYFDNDRCIGSGSKEVGRRGPGTPCWYKDTGCSFLEDIENSWKIQEIQLSNYIVHMKCTGQNNRDFRKFLNDNRDLF